MTSKQDFWSVQTVSDQIPHRQRKDAIMDCHRCS